jgi:hypothetical protein
MGEVCIGFYKATTYNPELQPLFGYDMPGSSYRESDGGQRYGFSTHTSVRKSWKFTWKYMSDTDKANLEFVYLLSGGTKRPLYVDLGAVLGESTPLLYYVRFMGPLQFTGLTKNAWSCTVNIEEEL